MILGPPSGRVRLAGRLEEAVGHLWVEQVEHQENDAELEGLQNFVAQVWDLVLGGPIGTSSLATSLSSVVEQIKDWVITVTANGVHVGTRSALTSVVSHFLKREVELELLQSGHNADLGDALWTWMRQASESLAAFIPLSVARGPHDDMGEE
jgi:hypothetical protein